MSKLAVFAIAVMALGPSASPTQAQTPTAQAPATSGQSGGSYDETLARSVGADDYGMRNYVLVILKTGPTKVPAGAERDEMFRGATDPVIVKGEMTAEYHKFYGSAALMLVPGAHDKVARKSF